MYGEYYVEFDAQLRDLDAFPTTTSTVPMDTSATVTTPAHGAQFGQQRSSN